MVTDQLGPQHPVHDRRRLNGDGKSDIALYYYAAQTPAVFTLTADSNGDGGFAAPVRRYTDQ
ncbi:hypothetical protein ABT186_45525 [Streptomyces sp. NPDC001634]|uniref:hypothetical protein n=1 Tax=Streptomyces sp. NPDC001634 TaxID=3154390 RepID=UPI00332F1DB9